MNDIYQLAVLTIEYFHDKFKSNMNKYVYRDGEYVILSAQAK